MDNGVHAGSQLPAGIAPNHIFTDIELQPARREALPSLSVPRVSQPCPGGMPKSALSWLVGPGRGGLREGRLLICSSPLAKGMR